MLRLSELRLPLDHPAEALPQLIQQRLGLKAGELLNHTVFKRSYDARKNVKLSFIYIVDLELKDEAAVLARHGQDPHLKPSPDMRYHFVAQAPASLPHRPVVIGFGPCGIFAALVLAQMGFKPIVLERGKAVRERTQDTWGLWRRKTLNPESNVQFGE
ncbi:MAG: hypothetical protein ACRCTU_11320, partial [Zoogloea sp.]